MISTDLPSDRSDYLNSIFGGPNEKKHAQPYDVRSDVWSLGITLVKIDIDFISDRSSNFYVLGGSGNWKISLSKISYYF